MLTPAFKLHQDADFITIVIKAPFAKVAEAEIFLEEDDFKFYSKPYFLRLTLPGKLVEDGREKADYNADTGEFHIQFPKATPGEVFEGLDMITRLLAPKGTTSAAPPLIQVLDDGAASDTGDEDDQEETFDWCIPQEPYMETAVPMSAPKYGFANQKSGVFLRLQEDLVGIVDCPNPDQLSVTERREKRLKAEREKFDVDHYIGDLYDDSAIFQLLTFRPAIYKELEQMCAGIPVEVAVNFSEEEEEVLRKLPRKQYLLDSVEETSVYLGLVDILYAYLYNHRTTEGENHCESGWTVCKISATLSWLEAFSGVKDVLVSCYRRTLCYPLYRNWKLSAQIQQDLVTTFRLGRRRILKCLLDVRSVLHDQDCRYVLNDLYITDFCVWIQSASAKRIHALAEVIDKIMITKADVDLGLEEAEHLAKVAVEANDEEVSVVSDKMAASQLEDSESDESDTTETDDECTDSDDVTTDNDDVAGISLVVSKDYGDSCTKDREISINTKTVEQQTASDFDKAIGTTIISTTESIVDVSSNTTFSQNTETLTEKEHSKTTSSGPSIVVLSESSYEEQGTEAVQDQLCRDVAECHLK